MELKRTIITDDGRRYDLTLQSKTIETHVHMTEHKAKLEDFMRDSAAHLERRLLSVEGVCNRCVVNGPVPA